MGWAAKATALLGVRAVLAEFYERIHRSNLVALGVLPLRFLDGESTETRHLRGHETYTVTGLDGADPGSHPATVTIRADDHDFTALPRLDTLREQHRHHHGGITAYVLRSLRIRARGGHRDKCS